MSLSVSEAPVLERIARLIRDLGELVELLVRGLSRAKPWQRQLASHLVDVDGQLQVLRLTVAMERRDVEILDAAKDLVSTCRLAAAALGGTRVDPTTRTAVQLFCDLAARIRSELEGLK